MTWGHAMPGGIRQHTLPNAAELCLTPFQDGKSSCHRHAGKRMHQRTATMQPWGCVALPTQKRGVHRRLEVAQHLGECRRGEKGAQKV